MQLMHTFSLLPSSCMYMYSVFYLDSGQLINNDLIKFTKLRSKNCSAHFVKLQQQHIHIYASKNCSGHFVKLEAAAIHFVLILKLSSSVSKLMIHGIGNSCLPVTLAMLYMQQIISVSKLIREGIIQLIKNLIANSGRLQLANINSYIYKYKST